MRVEQVTLPALGTARGTSQALLNICSSSLVIVVVILSFQFLCTVQIRSILFRRRKQRLREVKRPCPGSTLGAIRTPGHRKWKSRGSLQGERHGLAHGTQANDVTVTLSHALLVANKRN